jgi:hypothetical protein
MLLILFALAQSLTLSISTEQNTIFLFLLFWAAAVNIGLKRMQGGQKLAQKSTTTAGYSLISYSNSA